MYSSGVTRLYSFSEAVLIPYSKMNNYEAIFRFMPQGA